MIDRIITFLKAQAPEIRRVVFLPRAWFLDFVWCFSLMRKFGDNPPRHFEKKAKIDEWPVFYINLDSRPDRNLQILAQLSEIGLKNIERVPGEKHPIPLAGCASAHVTALERASKLGTFAIICEDDLEFICEREVFEKIVMDFLNDPNLDVLCIGNNLGRPVKIYSAMLALGRDISTASCYVVKPSAFAPLIRVFSRSAIRLKEGGKPHKFAHDVQWHQLQVRELTFSVPRNRIARQRSDYSDIQGRHVDYGL